MLRKAFAVADTCFLIDWARYRGRNVLFRLFKTVFVPEQVLEEVRSDNTISWIAEAMARDDLSLYTPTTSEVEEAMRLVEESRLHPRLPALDIPEALCLVVGRRRGYVVLTENRAALLAPGILSEYSGVTVWRSLEVLLNAVLTGALEPDCGDPEKPFREYSEDTLHVFPSKALRKAVEEVIRLCREKT